jgi:hypothetical protein
MTFTEKASGFCANKKGDPKQNRLSFSVTFGLGVKVFFL